MRAEFRGDIKIPATRHGQLLRPRATHRLYLRHPARRADRRPPFVGTSAALGRLVERLAARRRGRAAPDRPTGLLTHHLVLDEAGWAFAAELVRRSAGHGGARWLDPRQVFAAAARPPP